MCIKIGFICYSNTAVWYKVARFLQNSYANIRKKNKQMSLELAMQKELTKPYTRQTAHLTSVPCVGKNYILTIFCIKILSLFTYCNIWDLKQHQPCHEQFLWILFHNKYCQEMSRSCILDFFGKFLDILEQFHLHYFQYYDWHNLSPFQSMNLWNMECFLEQKKIIGMHKKYLLI